MTLSKETKEAVIQECIKHNLFMNGRFLHKGLDFLFGYFQKCISKKTISRLVRSHFIPSAVLPKRVPKPRKRKGGARGRPPKVNMWVRECIDEIGQIVANEYNTIVSKDLLDGLHKKGVEISKTTVCSYIREILKPKTFGVKFVLVDGSEWDDGRVAYKPPAKYLGNEDFDVYYTHDDCSVKVRLWKGLKKPYHSLPMLTNHMDTLEDNEDYVSMGGYNVLRYMPKYFKLY